LVSIFNVFLMIRLFCDHACTFRSPILHLPPALVFPRYHFFKHNGLNPPRHKIKWNAGMEASNAYAIIQVRLSLIPRSHACRCLPDATFNSITLILFIILMDCNLRSSTLCLFFLCQSGRLVSGWDELMSRGIGVKKNKGMTMFIIS
jgi:hypothetical protein